MARCNLPKRRARLRILCSSAAIFTAAASAATPAAVEQCIVGDGAIGCVSERAIVELTTPRKDAGTLQQLVQDKLASGQCRLFDYGERVQLTSTQGSERTQIRRPGDKASYWIAASWSRPATDCDGTRSAAALHQKLGLPAAHAEQSSADERDPALADERVPSFSDARIRSFADERAAPRHHWDDDDASDDDARYADDGSRRPLPLPSRPLPSSRYAHDCAFKSVMTDADMNACRNVRR
jgi:hypothetical protein